MNKPTYTYRAVITNVVDGDTVDANVDLGFSARLMMRLRLKGVDTPEIVGPDRAAALTAKEWMADALSGEQVIIETTKDRSGRDRRDKWNRYLAVIWLNGANINEELIKQGLGVRA